MAEGKRCHSGEMEIVPRQHSDDPVAHGDTDAKGSWCECDMQDDGVLADTGFPHVCDKAKEGQRAPTVRTRGEQGCISYNMHSFSDGRSWRIYLRSKRFEADGFDGT